MHCLSHLWFEYQWFEYQCLMFSFPSFHLFEKISQSIHLITTYIRCYWERMGDGPLKMYFFGLCWGYIISRRVTCFFITWESSYLWLILPDRCQSLAQRPFFLLQDNHIASQICLWPPNQFIWANNPPIRVFHDWRAHGLMVLRGKHGNSSNFADPPHTNRLEDKSSELKHVCGPVVILPLQNL